MRMGQRRVILLVLAAILLGGLVAAPAALAAGEEANVIGQLQGYGYNWSVNLPGAYIAMYNYLGTYPTWLLNDTGFFAITDDFGWYSITTDTTLPLYYGANVVLWPTVSDYGQKLSPVFSLEPYQVKVVNWKLQVLPTAFSGTVKSNKTGKALKKVKVGVAGKYVYTDNKGKWKVNSLFLKPGTKYKVTYTKKGYKKLQKSYMSVPTGPPAAGDPIIYTAVGTVKLKLK